MKLIIKKGDLVQAESGAIYLALEDTNGFRELFLGIRVRGGETSNVEIGSRIIYVIYEKMEEIVKGCRDKKK